MADSRSGDPAQAFDDLRAEVSVLRRAIEGLPATLRENRSPDYSADLAVIGKGLDEIGAQLEAVLLSPVLMMTPEQQGQGIARAGSALVREAVQRLNEAGQAAERERAQLAGIVGQARARERQFRMIGWVGGGALALGLLLSPLLASILPFELDTRIAAIILRADRWTGAEAMMRVADPARFDALLADRWLAQDNAEAVTACRTSAVRTGKAQRCVLSIKPPQEGGAP